MCGGVFSRNPYTGAVSYSEEGVVGMAMAGNVPLQVGKKKKHLRACLLRIIFDQSECLGWKDSTPNTSVLKACHSKKISLSSFFFFFSYIRTTIVYLMFAAIISLSLCCRFFPSLKKQALVTRGAKPLGAAQLVTKCSSVSSPSGTPYLLLERASAILHEEDDSNQGSVAGSGRRGSGSSGSNRSNNRSAEAASANDRNVMAALQEALYASGGDGGGGMGMYYLGLQVNSSTSSSNSRSSANSTSQSRSDGSEG